MHRVRRRKTEAKWSESTFQAEHRGNRSSVTLVRFAWVRMSTLRVQLQLEPTARSSARVMRMRRRFRPSRTYIESCTYQRLRGKMSSASAYSSPTILIGLNYEKPTRSFVG